MMGEKYYYYRMAGNFRGVQFSRMVDLYNFAGLISRKRTLTLIMYCTIELISRV